MPKPNRPKFPRVSTRVNKIDIVVPQSTHKEHKASIESSRAEEMTTHSRLKNFGSLEASAQELQRKIDSGKATKEDRENLRFLKNEMARINESLE